MIKDRRPGYVMYLFCYAFVIFIDWPNPKYNLSQLLPYSMATEVSPFIYHHFFFIENSDSTLYHAFFFVFFVLNFDLKFSCVVLKIAWVDQIAFGGRSR